MEDKGFFASSYVLIRSRLDIILGVSWTASLATIIAGNGFPPIRESILSIVAVTMTIASVYIYNDIIDREMDAFSKQEKKKQRPIANGTVSYVNAVKFVIVTGFLGLGICISINPIIFLIALSYYVLVFLYSYPRVRFKSVFVLKNLITSLLFPTAYLVGGVGVSNAVSGSLLLMAAVFYLITVLVIPSIADMLDYDEDRAFNVKTIGNSISWRWSLFLYNLGIVVFILGNFMNFLLFNVSLVVPVLTSVIGVFLMFYSFSLRDEIGQIASYKLRPISFTVLLLNPLILAVGILI